jgi:outer membrane biosynthesis protein TonB
MSFGLHSFLLTLAYFGLPAIKNKEPIELPIDIVEDTPISSKSSLKLGEQKIKKIKTLNKKTEKKEIIKKKPAPPPVPTKKQVEKKKLALEKDKEIKKIATLIKKKPKIEITKKKKSDPPKIVKKPEKIKKTQKENLAKGILKTLTKPQVQKEKIKKDKKNSNKDVLNKIKAIAGNSRRQVQQTEIKLSQTDINRIQMHVTKYFNLSYSATEVKIIIPLKISANTDGTIKSAKILESSIYEKDKFYRAAADAARRAVLDSSPLPLPKGKEKKFQNFIFDFNTSFINDY